MRVEFDITSDDPSGEWNGRGTLPDRTVLQDDGNILLSFGEVLIRMTYGQFDALIDGCHAWRNAIPAEEMAALNEQEP